MRTTLLVVLLAALAPLAACDKSSTISRREAHERVPFVGGDAATRALATRFLGARTPDVIRTLRPTRADLGVVFDAASVDALDAFYGRLWDGPDLARIPAIPKDTTVTISDATSDELRSGKPPFPAAYARAARHLKPGLSLHSLRFQSGGMDMSFDLFVDVGAGRWVFLPTPWKGLPPE